MHMPSKLIYADLSLHALTLKDIEPIKKRATETLTHLLKTTQIFSPLGEQVFVSVNFFDIDNRAVIFRSACAAPASANHYTITFGGGLLARLYTLAQAISADKTVLRGHGRTKLRNSEARDAGRAKVLHELCFHIMLLFVYWHETAHIVLGHLDWLGSHSGVDSIDEFSLPSEPIDTLLYRRTLEADADRQAAIWSCATVEVALKNSLIQYASLIDVFHDVGYIYAALFCFFDSVDTQVADELRKHPKPHIRLATSLSFCQDYFSKYHSDASQRLQNSVYEGGMSALRHMHYESRKPLDPLEIINFMGTNGTRIEEMKLRAFQQSMDVGVPSSFSVSDLDE